MPGYQTRTSNSGGNNTSDWQKMLAMYQLAGNNDASTMFGFALGKLLNQAWMDHIDRRHTREEQEYNNQRKTAASTANAITGANGMGALGRAGEDVHTPIQQRVSNDLLSNAMAQGVATGKINPQFASNVLTGGYNVGNGIGAGIYPRTQATQATQATQGNGYYRPQVVSINVDPSSSLGKAAQQYSKPQSTTVDTKRFSASPDSKDVGYMEQRTTYFPMDVTKLNTPSIAPTSADVLTEASGYPWARR